MCASVVSYLLAFATGIKLIIKIILDCGF